MGYYINHMANDSHEGNFTCRSSIHNYGFKISNQPALCGCELGPMLIVSNSDFYVCMY